MKQASILLLAAHLAAALPLPAQDSPRPSASATVPAGYEALPVLNASTILQPQYLQGPNFLVRNAVPTHAGTNHYTIDSDFGVFEAEGNQNRVRSELQWRRFALSVGQSLLLLAAAKARLWRQL